MYAPAANDSIFRAEDGEGCKKPQIKLRLKPLYAIQPTHLSLFPCEDFAPCECLPGLFADLFKKLSAYEGTPLNALRVGTVALRPVKNKTPDGGQPRLATHPREYVLEELENGPYVFFAVAFVSFYLETF
jgi:hypothetical protein